MSSTLQSLLDRLGPEEITVLEDKKKEVQTVLDEKRKELKALQGGELAGFLSISEAERSDLSDTMALPKTKDLSKTIEQVKAEVSQTPFGLR